MDSHPQELIDRTSSYLTNAKLKHTICWVLTQTMLRKTNTQKNVVLLTMISLGGTDSDVVPLTM